MSKKNYGVEAILASRILQLLVEASMWKLKEY